MKRPISFPPIVPSLVFACLAGTSSLFGAAQIWDDAGTDDIWSTSATNWTGDVAWTNGNNALFNAATGETVTIQGTVAAAGLTSNFSAIALTTGYTIAGSTGAVLDLSASGGSSGTAKPIISNAGANTITANILLSGTGTATGNRVVSIGTGHLTLSGDISEAGIPKGLSVGGSSGGILTLSGNNTFTGGVALSNSNLRLNINSATALGTGNVSVAGSPITLDNTSAGAVTLTANNNISLNNATTGTTSTNNVVFAGTNDLSFGTGVVTMSIADKAISVTANTLTLGGLAEGTAGRSFFKNGAGNLNLIGASTYTGNTTISGGSLRLGNGGASGSLTTGGTISISAGANLTINRSDTAAQGADFSATAISGAGSFTQAGTGTTILNVDNLYTGGTNISLGTLLVTNLAGSGTGTGTVTLTGTGKLGGSGRITPTGSNGLSFASGTGVDLSVTAGIDLLTIDLTATTGSSTFLSGSTFEFDLSSGNLSDALSFTGLDAASVVAFDLNSVTLTNAAAGLYTLFIFAGGATQADNYTGTLSDTIFGLSGGQTASWIYNSDSIQLSVVPEPSSTWLLTAGLLLLVTRRNGNTGRSVLP